MYLSAFSKQRKGGLYYLGLDEEKELRGLVWKPQEHMEGFYAVFGEEKRFWKDKVKGVATRIGKVGQGEGGGGD